MELLGLGKRICDNYKRFQSNANRKEYSTEAFESREPILVNSVKTEINFDFHRLNILVLRKSKLKDKNIGRKVGTLTLSEAKIHAELGSDACVSGALGGIQFIDVTSETLCHQRIFSVGMDPVRDRPYLFNNDALYTLTYETYGISDDKIQYKNAISFKISQSNISNINVNVRMASVWYTHCPKFIEEIYLCAKEFEQHFT